MTTTRSRRWEVYPLLYGTARIALTDGYFVDDSY